MSWIFILIYLFIQLAIGYWVSLRITSEKDYFLAGRNLGVFAVSFSLFATWFGAETCIGSAGAIYEIGLAGGRADPFGYSLNFLILGLFVAIPFWKGGYTTLADFYRVHFGEKLEKFAVWIMMPTSIVWAGAQLKAFGEVIAATSPLSSEVGLTIAAIFVIAYTFLGGLLGDIITDVLQGGILLLTLIIVFVFVINDNGGWSETIAMITPDRLSMVRADETIFQRIDRMLIPIIGAVFTQELISRVLASKDAAVARKSSFVAGLMYISLGAIPAFLGLIGPKLLPGLENPEEYLPLLAQKVLPQALYILFSGALISAILSTIDSILLAQSSLITHNFLVPVFKVTSEKRKIHLARLTVVAAGVAAYFLAMSSERIYDLVLFAESLGTSGIVVVSVIGLIFKKGDEWAAMAAMLTGLFIMPVYNNYLEVQAPFISSMSTCLAVYVTVAFVRRLEFTKSFLNQEKNQY